jgi:hypothetical protein
VLQNPRGNVDRGSNFRDPSRVFDLQTVQRIVPIANFANAQILVRASNYFGKRSHRAIVTPEIKNARLWL